MIILAGLKDELIVSAARIYINLLLVGLRLQICL